MDTTETKGKTRKVAGLRIAAKRDGFRRAGRAWSMTATDVPLSEFKRAQVEQLKNDPMLVVVECEVEVTVG